jgi:hypothetical protein
MGEHVMFWPHALGYNIYKETQGTYEGYPLWAVVVFGWMLCVLLPLSFIFMGVARPMYLQRPKAGRCRLTASQPELRAPLVSALETEI